MSIRTIVIGIVGLAAVVATAADTREEPRFKEGDRTFTLSGSGSSDKDFDANIAALQVGLGWLIADDRENAAVEMYFNDSDAVIFRLLRIALDDAPRMPFFICGELAGRAAHVPTLLRCGIRTLSVTPPLIPVIKEAVRSSSTQ